LLSVAVLCATFAARARACFSIVVGKNASVDGCVLVAHNEDDTAPQVVNHHKVPRRTHLPGETVTLRNGGQLEQVGETWAYLWSEMPGMQFSDSYVNQWGVCVTSDNCPSREDEGELTDGGIGSMLRRLVAERARSAREGVRIAGEMVERFGYVASGRTYIIADPEEGWLFCVVQGKHWLARRVGDDEVAMVANTYTVGEVDLSDGSNILASEDIAAYASERGWHKPGANGIFDFAATYANPKSAAHPVNYGRQSIGFRYVAARPGDFGDKLPFSVVPSRKLGAQDLMRVLRHDGKGSSICTLDGQELSCDDANAICRRSTQTGFVVQLRKQPSRDLGIVYWTCLAAPESSVFIPFHFGIAGFPAGFASESERPSPEYFDERVSSPFRPDPLQAFWTFSNFRNKVRSMPDDARTRVLSKAEAIESKAARMQTLLEEAVHKLGGTRKAAAPKLLTNFSNGIYLSALEMMAETPMPDGEP
jgi:dipeptidase